MIRFKGLIASTAILFSGLFVPIEGNAQTPEVWKKVCADANKIETCRITQQLFLSQKGKDGKQHVAGRILGLNVLYATDSQTKKRQPYLSVQMPMGVDLRPGAVLKIDKGADIPISYLRCTNAGCDASVQLDSELLKTLKAGNDLFVGFLPWGSGQTTILKASLTGFSKAFSVLK